MALPRNLVYPASRNCWDRTRYGERGNKPGFCTWLALPPHTENSYPTDRCPVGFPFMEIFCVPAGSVADVQLFLLFFFPPSNSFSSFDSIKQTFGPAVNREHTRPVAGSL